MHLQIYFTIAHLPPNTSNPPLAQSIGLLHSAHTPSPAVVVLVLQSESKGLFYLFLCFILYIPHVNIYYLFIFISEQYFSHVGKSNFCFYSELSLGYNTL